MTGARRAADADPHLATARGRLVAGAFLFTLAFMVVGARLIELGVASAASPPAAAPASPAGAIAPRADILDRNGAVLASDMPSVSLVANLARIRDPEGAAAALARVFPYLDQEALAAKLARGTGYRQLRRHLTPAEQDGVNRLGNPAFEFIADRRRVYPMGRLTAHVVGFTGIDGNGLSGIERAMQERLAGDDTPLRLTIDTRVQHVLREEMARQVRDFEAVGGGGVVLDVNTGEVLALVSLPDFDPAEPALIDSESGLNRMTQGRYELGSVFKPVNHAIALETGAVQIDEMFDVSEPLRIGGFVIRDFETFHGSLSMADVLVRSSNIGAALIAQRIGIARQRAFFDRLGLLERSPIELRETQRPQLTTPWVEVSTMTAGYGHGIAVTPLNLASAIAAVVNGGAYVRPTLIRRDDDAPVVAERVFSQATSDIMRGLMRLVVQDEDGTGGFARVVGYDVGGKTGTAEQFVGGAYVEDALISSFIGVFPMAAPRYAVMIMLDRPKGTAASAGFATGGWTAAPAVGRTIARIGPLVGLRPAFGLRGEQRKRRIRGPAPQFRIEAQEASFASE